LSVIDDLLVAASGRRAAISLYERCFVRDYLPGTVLDELRIQPRDELLGGEVDLLSGGQLILGLVAGWTVRDYEMCVKDRPTVWDRLRALLRGIEIIQGLWTICVPPPLLNPPPD